MKKEALMKYSKEELVSYIYYVHGAGLDIHLMKNIFIFSSLNQKMGFGKYKHETLGYVIEEDIQYIRWMMRVTAHFIMPELLEGIKYDV